MYIFSRYPILSPLLPLTLFFPNSSFLTVMLCSCVCVYMCVYVLEQAFCREPKPLDALLCVHDYISLVYAKKSVSWSSFLPPSSYIFLFPFYDTHLKQVIQMSHLRLSTHQPLPSNSLTKYKSLD